MWHAPVLAPHIEFSLGLLPAFTFSVCTFLCFRAPPSAGLVHLPLTHALRERSYFRLLEACLLLAVVVRASRFSTVYRTGCGRLMHVPWLDVLLRLVTLCQGCFLSSHLA